MKKAIALLVAAVLLLGLFAGCAKKDPEPTEPAPTYSFTYRDLPEAKYITPAASFAGGSGTAEDPYQIADAAQLALMHKSMTEGELLETAAYEKAHYVLTADIALNDTANYADWSTTAPEYQWMPIGRVENGGSANFKGVLDGQGHTISGLYINTNCESTVSEYGLFARVRGTVKNLTLDKSYFAVSGMPNKMGGIVGILNGGRDACIENCTVNAEFYSYDSTVGGIAATVSDGNQIGGGEAYDTQDMPAIRGCTFNGTITQVKEGSGSHLGGIFASGYVFAENCENKGTISFSGDNTDAVGGICATVGAGEVKNCKNTGKLLCTQTQSKLNRAGGIVGVLMLSSMGGEKYMSRGVTVRDCQNYGTVQGGMAAGGIAGWANNDHNDWCLTVTGCTNESSEIAAADNMGGIIGSLYCTGDNDNGTNVLIDNCENKADLKGSMPGGIIGLYLSSTGEVVIKNCRNSGSLSATGQHCAGIIAYWLMKSEVSGSTTVENCDNSGSIYSTLNAGGIVSYMDLPVAAEIAKDTKITVTGCDNTGDITVEQINGYVGGVLGNFGMGNISTTVENCTASCTIKILDVLTEEAIEEAKYYEERGMKGMRISRIVGGIVGRVGSGLLLTVDNDKGNAKNVQSDKPVLRISGCSANVTLALADTTETYMHKNFLGGIVGDTSAEDAFAMKAENCTYTGFERALGNKEYTDIG